MQLNTLVIDVDHTICVPNDNETGTYEKYALAKPIPEMIDSIRVARENGFRIILYTARRMATHDGNINKVIEDVAGITIKWLKDHDVPYDELQFGKPNAMYYVDDKAIRPDEFIKMMRGEE